MWLNFKRILRAGLINFKRNGTVSLAAVLVMTVTLCVLTGLLFLQTVLYSSLEQIKSQVDVTVYFNLNVPESKIISLKSSLDRLPEVASSTYVSAEDALERFQERHKDDYLTLQALEELGENPLPAELNIKAKEVTHYESIANFLDKETLLAKGGESIINKIDYHQNKLVIERLNSIISNANALGAGLGIILIALSMLIVFITIRLAIYIARDEIKVMRLVGGSRSYISGPFIIEGAFYGFLSAVLSVIIFYPISLWLGNKMTAFLGVNLYRYYISNFFEIFLIILAAGVLLGIISSWLAIQRYINK